MNNKTILGVIAVVVVVGLGALVLTNNQTKTKTTQPPQQPTSQSGISPQVSPQESTDAASMDGSMKGMEKTIAVSSSGFEPKEVTVDVGTKVVWENDSSGIANVSSVLHPTHQVYPPLNLGDFQSGTSVSLVFDKPGTYRYHDHLQPSRTGTVIVTE